MNSQQKTELVSKVDYLLHSNFQPAIEKTKEAIEPHCKKITEDSYQSILEIVQDRIDTATFGILQDVKKVLEREVAGTPTMEALEKVANEQP